MIHQGRIWLKQIYPRKLQRRGFATICVSFRELFIIHPKSLLFTKVFRLQHEKWQFWEKLIFTALFLRSQLAIGSRKRFLSSKWTIYQIIWAIVRRKSLHHLQIELSTRWQLFPGGINAPKRSKCKRFLSSRNCLHKKPSKCYIKLLYHS